MIGNQKKLRVGVMGGGMGTYFVFHEHPHSVVEAVSDLIPARRDYLKERFKCDKAYNSFEEMILDKNIDAVAVFSGAPDHVRHCVAALKQGKHVFCAVPAATTIEDAELLLETVKQTGLTYMMAETSYYYQAAISARMFYKEGKFGRIYYTESEYYHPGLSSIMFNPDGSHTWRYGYPPMLYPTHNTSLLISITGERLTDVTCRGWGDNSPILKDNEYNNPFWAEFAMFGTNLGNSMRIGIGWSGALPGSLGAEWSGEKMSFYMPKPGCPDTLIIKSSANLGTDSAGYVEGETIIEKYDQPQWWNTDMLPEELRIGGGHDGSHMFLTHEFVDSIINNRQPAIDIHEALAYTVPGIIAHQSALKGGEQMSIPNYD
ncbi:MAG: Gfo/Idh/MocA family protein [Armatimonadota bacterium]